MSCYGPQISTIGYSSTPDIITKVSKERSMSKPGSMDQAVHYGTHFVNPRSYSADVRPPQHSQLGELVSCQRYGPVQNVPAPGSFSTGESLSISGDTGIDLVNGSRASRDFWRDGLNYQSDRNAFQSQIFSNLPDAYNSYVKPPLCATSGGCCYHRHGIQQLPYWVQPALRQQNYGYHPLLPYHNSHDSFIRAPDAVRFPSQPSPAPTLSDCTTASDSSTYMNSSFGSIYERTPSCVEMHDNPTYVDAVSSQSYNGSLPFQLGSDSTDGSEGQVETDTPTEYTSTFSSYQLISGPANDSLKLTAMPSSTTSFSSQHLYSYETPKPNNFETSHASIPRSTEDPQREVAANIKKHPSNRPKLKPNPRQGRKAVEKPTPRKTLSLKGPRRDRSPLRDNFLIESKLAGMSYKDIKEQGKYEEAESTLRGRFRNLTKEREERVRRPHWTDADVSLLKAAVSRFGREADVNPRNGRSSERGQPNPNSRSSGGMSQTTLRAMEGRINLVLELVARSGMK